MWRGLRLLWFLLSTFAAVDLRAAQNRAVPDLPSLALENFSPGIRNQIQEASADARTHPDDSAATGRLGMVLQTYGLLDEAALCYRRAIRLAPSDFRWAYYLGRVEASQGHCDEAKGTLRSALRGKPDYVPAQLQLANCMLASANWKEAVELYSVIAKEHPENAEAFYGLGRVRAADHNYAGAAEAYGRACAQFPEFGAAHYALALTYRALGRTGEVQEHFRLYERNRDRVPPANDPLLEEVRALNRSATNQVQIGVEFEKQGKLEESVAAHEKALKIDPELVQAHVNLIALYGRLGQFEKSEEHYKAAVKLDPGSAESYYDYGVLLVGAEKYAQAEEAFRKTLEIDPLHGGAHTNLGILLERTGRSPAATAEYRKALESTPNSRQAHFNLGRVLVNEREYAAGIEELRKTLDPQDEDTPRYVYALGAALARSGDRQSAVRYLHQAREGAQARGQSALVASIDRDLRTLERPGNSQ
jgi:tetratricopeptide (TPR) repeat protein